MFVPTVFTSEFITLDCLYQWRDTGHFILELVWPGLDMCLNAIYCFHFSTIAFTWEEAVSVVKCPRWLYPPSFPHFHLKVGPVERRLSNLIGQRWSLSSGSQRVWLPSTQWRFPLTLGKELQSLGAREMSWINKLINFTRGSHLNRDCPKATTDWNMSPQGLQMCLCPCPARPAILTILSRSDCKTNR